MSSTGYNSVLPITGSNSGAFDFVLKRRKMMPGCPISRFFCEKWEGVYLTDSKEHDGSRLNSVVPALQLRQRLGTSFMMVPVKSSRPPKGLIYGVVEHPDTLAVLLLDVRGHFIVCGCGFDVHWKNIWTVWWLGVARQGTGGVLVDSRNSLLRRRLFHRIFLV